MNHPKSMFQLSGVHYNFNLKLLKPKTLNSATPEGILQSYMWWPPQLRYREMGLRAYRIPR